MSLNEEDLGQLRAWVDEAIIRTEEVAESFPDERLLKSVRRQLEYLFAVSRGTHRPTPAESRRYALGLTARRLEPVDERLSRLVSRMSNYLDSDEY
jgi:hypothetical protein